MFKHKKHFREHKLHSSSCPTSHKLVLPAIKGNQGASDYFLTQMMYSDLLASFKSAGDKSPCPIEHHHISDICHYILDNTTDYTLPPIIVSVQSLTFTPHRADPTASSGKITISNKTTFSINDGLHRLRAIELAVEKCPSLGSETIPVQMFLYRGVEHAEQIYADHNFNTVTPAQISRYHFDHRGKQHPELDVNDREVLNTYIRAQTLESPKTWLQPSVFEINCLMRRAGLATRDFARIIGATELEIKQARTGDTPISYPAWAILCSLAGLGNIWNRYAYIKKKSDTKRKKRVTS